MATFVEQHSGELMILVLFILVVAALFVLVPQLLRVHLQKAEMQHLEHMRALEQGQVVPSADEAFPAAGRTAMLVPMVVIIAAATVTCFLIAYKPGENLFSITLAVWTVAGIVSLAAVTGGVALIGRLAQLRSGEEEHELPKNPLEEGE